MRVAEEASAEDLFAQPRHPYTRGLLNSIPRLENERKITLNTIEGMVPGLLEMPKGCRFENRCPYAQNPCRASAPALEEDEGKRSVACFLWNEIK